MKLNQVENHNGGKWSEFMSETRIPVKSTLHFLVSNHQVNVWKERFNSFHFKLIPCADKRSNLAEKVCKITMCHELDPKNLTSLPDCF